MVGAWSEATGGMIGLEGVIDGNGLITDNPLS